MPNSLQRGSSLVVVLLLAVVGIGLFFWYKNFGGTPAQLVIPDNNYIDKVPDSSTPKTFTFENPKKSAHYETNTPKHGAVLAAPPVNIVIDFNFDLAPPSSISIKQNGKEYGIGETTIDTNKLAMRRPVDSNAPEGLYTVEYNACWPDKTCHDGHFQFAIDRSRSSTFKDMTEFDEVKIQMANNSFNVKDMKVKRGTRVMWINNDNVTHYVNTDSHPAHTYFLSQNSKALSKGDTYSVTFDEPGIYPYHCSAHESVMTGQILVE